jgi:uncharacterized protein (TIGR03067 family)
MGKRITLVLAVALLGAWVTLPRLAAEEKADAAKKDLAKFQGTWKFVSMEQAGQPAKEPDPPQTITFEGDKFTVKQGDKIIQAGTHKLDPTTKPRSADAMITEGEGKDSTMLGIYEFVDDNTLKACFDPQGKKRPTEFKTTADSGTMLVVIKREKK